VAEKLDWKGLKIKKSVGNRKMIMSNEVRHRIGKGLNVEHANGATCNGVNRFGRSFMYFKMLNILKFSLFGF
jgi:hypothetical protein